MADRRLDAQRLQFCAPLPECDEQCAEQRRDIEPRRDRHVDGHGSRRRAQDEPAGNAEDVEQHDVFERGAVDRGQQQVRQRQQAQQQVDDKRSGQPTDGQNGCQPKRAADP